MAKKKAKKKTKKIDSLLVGSKCKDTIRKAGCNVAGDALESLNDAIYWHIEQAAARAKANGRKTVRGYDFVA